MGMPNIEEEEEEEEQHQPNVEQNETTVGMQMAGVPDDQDEQILNDAIVGVPDRATDRTTEEDNSEAEGQENSPIKCLRQAFKQANDMLQGEIREIQRAMKRQ
eukprot:8769320-Ditylum_brightwellii.AAC.1